jgi:glycerophosphoryl diester phosphodiesterase
VVGHRGALYEELENTRAGFVRCAELGCDAVELDVFLLKDNNLVVFHGGGSDEHPGDLANYCVTQQRGNILDLTYEQTQQLVFNTQFDEFPCPVDKIQQGRIPALEQVLLDLKPTKTQVKIELKGPGVVEPVLELVERLDMVDQCQFSSFDLGRIKLLRELRPQIGADGRYVYKTGALFDHLPEDFVSQAMSVGASEVHLRYDYCTVEHVNAIHAAGMESMAWFRGPVGMQSDVTHKYWDIGNEDERCYQALIDSGVSQLCVNRPDVLIRMLKRQQEQDYDAPTPTPPQVLPSPMLMDAATELEFGLTTPPPHPIPIYVEGDESL